VLNRDQIPKPKDAFGLQRPALAELVEKAGARCRRRRAQGSGCSITDKVTLAITGEHRRGWPLPFRLENGQVWRQTDEVTERLKNRALPLESARPRSAPHDEDRQPQSSRVSG
jgi:hypothetical protein